MESVLKNHLIALDTCSITCWIFHNLNSNHQSPNTVNTLLKFQEKKRLMLLEIIMLNCYGNTEVYLILED